MHMDSADKRPLVSIIMPSYNRAGFIVETINSIQRQTYENWELLIMDDGSDDGTAAIVRSINDSRIKYYNDGRVGITGALKNKGIILSKGELVAFMDSDDLWPEQKLELQVTALQQFPEAAFSFTNGHNFNKTGIEAIFYKEQPGIESGNYFEAICKGDRGVFLQTLMVWKKHLATDNLFKENRIFTDFSFISNLAYKYRAVVLNEQLFYRRIHDTNNVSQNWSLDYDEHIETILRYYKEGRLSVNVAKNILFLTYIHYGQEYIKYGKRREARRLFIKAWRYNLLNLTPLKKFLKTLL